MVRRVPEIGPHKQHSEREVTIDAVTGQVINVHHDAGMGEE